MCRLLSRKHFGHPHQVVPVVAVEADVLNLCLNESDLLSSVSTGVGVFLYTGAQTWPKVEKYLN